MRRHILDHPRDTSDRAPVTQFAGAARRLAEDTTNRKILGLRRRAKGPHDPAARVRAFLAIERRQAH